MKMLRNITDCESLEVSQENFNYEVSFSKVARRQCSDCNFAVKRLATDSFQNMYRKLVALKN